MDKKKKNPRKKKKTHLIFDEKERSEYLTGFRKRNLERKLKGRKELEEQIKQEKKDIKQKQRETLQNAIQTQRQVPEIQHLLDPVTYDLPDHTVTISQLDDLSEMRTSNASITNGDFHTTISGVQDQDEVEKLRKIITDLKSNRIKTLKHSLTQAKAKKMQKKKNKQTAMRQQRSFKRSSKKIKKKHKNKKR